jgi:thioredoxin 1
MAIQDINQLDFDEKVTSAKVPVLVDFYAVWCGPCKMAEPILEELQEESGGKVNFYKLNVDECQGVAQKYQVMSIPTTILFKDGQEVGRQIGFSGKQGFEELIKKVG